MASDAIPDWYIIARGYLGTAEIPGRKHNPVILRMWRWAKLDFSDDETPWCAGFVNACLEQAGIKGTRSGLALSFLDWGKRVDRRLGSIAVMRRKNSAGKVIGGHVAFVAGIRTDGAVILLGGNQGDKVSLAPFPAHRIISYRWPTAVAVPQRVLLPPYHDDGSPYSTNEA